ncbi:MAG: hypothetical protein PHR92_03915 [Lachnospiraceae bacterium]|nr:hypothetical protein [Lachnospiraceae bacterium]
MHTEIVSDVSGVLALQDDFLVLLDGQRNLRACAPLRKCILFYSSMEADKDGRYRAGLYIPGYEELVEFQCDTGYQEEFQKLMDEMQGTCAVIAVERYQAEAIVAGMKEKREEECQRAIQGQERRGIFKPITYYKGGRFMFLCELDEEEKKKYLSMAKQFADIDGSSTEEEKAVLYNSQNEMGMKAQVQTGETLEELAAYFSDKSKQVRRTLLFELYMLAFCDGDLTEEEKAVLRMLLEKFNISRKKAKEIRQLAIDLQMQYERILDVLH